MKRRNGQLGWIGYARVLIAIKESGGISRIGLHRAGVVCGTAGRRIVRAFHAAGLVHIAGYESAPRVTPTPILAFGPGHDVTPPDGPHRTLYESCEPEPAMLGRFVTGMQLPSAEPMSIRELCERLGVGWWVGASNTLRALRRAGMAHVAAWEPRGGNGGAPIECFAFGPGKDAARPKPEKRRDINRRYRERARARAQFSGLQSVMASGWASNASQREDAA